MPKSDEHNILHAQSAPGVDALNAAFYGKIRYPWPPTSFERVADARFWARQLAQDVGAWGRELPPAGGRVWVAGCGTNQALLTALRFPDVRVVGSDLSRESLEVCERNARLLGVDNLELRRESLNEVTYRDEFDYVVCTGVIHHNADPAVTLRRLAAALAPVGTLELMVYNRYHRLATTAFQKALQEFAGASAEQRDLEHELLLARRLLAGARLGSALAALAERVRDLPEAAFMDALLQPVEYSYTVESLAQLAHACGLELAVPCLDVYSKTAGKLSWNLELHDPALAADYFALPDVRRWQITNLLLGEDSPMLWFYLRRRDAPDPRLGEADVCAGFLDARLRPARTTRTVHVRTDDGGYRKGERVLPFPGRPRDPVAARVLEALDPQRPVRATLERLQLPCEFPAANLLRLQLASTACPYLEAV